MVRALKSYNVEALTRIAEWGVRIGGLGYPHLNPLPKGEAEFHLESRDRERPC
jgi:hypothetical protein